MYIDKLDVLEDDMVSVIMSTYNKANYLERTLVGFQLQTYKNFEIIIVDDGSEDNTAEVIKKFQKDLDIKYSYQKNKGIAMARNKALKLAKGDIIIITDDDRIPGLNFVFGHFKNLNNSEKIVSIGNESLIVSKYVTGIELDFNKQIELYEKVPRLLDEESIWLLSTEDLISDFNAVISKFSLGETNNTITLANRAQEEGDLQTTPMAWSRAYGGNIAFKRSMCETIPEYDCGFIGYGGEDVDLSYQLYLQGFRYVFNRMAINYHQEHIRGTDEMRSIYKNFNYFHDKYKSLEIFLMKMEWEGKITFDQSNAFLSVINREKDNINGLILEYLER